MSLHVWVGSYQRYAACSAAKGRWTLGSAFSHMDICLLAEEAKSRGKHPSVAITYDEVARKAWSERVKSKFPGFNVEVACRTLDKDLLQQAEALHEARGKSLASKKFGSQEQSSWRQPWKRPYNQQWQPSAKHFKKY